MEINNPWKVSLSNNTQLTNPLYVTLRKVDSHWEIDGIYSSAPKLKQTENLELFMATRDLQLWTNYYLNSRIDCDNFEVRESDFHSVCSSKLAEKKAGRAFVGMFFGGSGKVPFAYDDDKVKFAVNSIPVIQAEEMLAAFEKGAMAAKRAERAAAERQVAEQRKASAAQVAARKAAPIGAKDWCEQTVKEFGLFIQVDPTYTCRNYGVVSDEALREEGWAITNRNERQIGDPRQRITVADIAIEKVPR